MSRDWSTESNSPETSTETEIDTGGDGAGGFEFAFLSDNASGTLVDVGVGAPVSIDWEWPVGFETTSQLTTGHLAAPSPDDVELTVDGVTTVDVEVEADNDTECNVEAWFFKTEEDIEPTVDGKVKAEVEDDDEVEDDLDRERRLSTMNNRSSTAYPFARSTTNTNQRNEGQTYLCGVVPAPSPFRLRDCLGSFREERLWSCRESV